LLPILLVTKKKKKKKDFEFLLLEKINVEDKSHTLLSYDLAMKFGNHYKDVVCQKWLSSSSIR
jgi:hypothetical protein